MTRPDGSERSHQIEADIHRTRAAMDRTVEAIAGKLTPQQLALEAMAVLRDGSSALATRAVETARQHPVPATIIGIGLGLLLAEKARRDAGPRATGTGDRVQGFDGYGAHAAGEPSVRTDTPVAARAEGVTAAMKEKAAEVKETVAEGAAHLREQVAEGAGRVREQAAQVPDYARRQWHEAQLGFWQTMDQKPFAIGLAALAAGVAAGLAVPSSRQEQELMGATRDRLLDQAKDLGREAADKGRQVARAATEVVKAEVAKQGLAPAALAERVRAVSREAEVALKKEAEKVLPEPLKARGAPLPGAGAPNPGGAAGTGLSAGFASATETWDPDSTVPGPTRTIR